MNGDGSRASQRAQKRSTSRSLSAAQMAPSAAASVVLRNPLSSGSKSSPRLVARRLARSWPLRHSHTGNGAYATVLTNAGPHSGSRTSWAGLRPYAGARKWHAATRPWAGWHFAERASFRAGLC